MRVVVCLILVGLCAAAGARMYQWPSPATGRPELSGTPPAWYRSGSGPRVRVYENGNLIDDTAIRLSPEQNQLLRETAFEEFEQRKTAKRLERLAARIAAKRRREEAKAARSLEAAEQGRRSPARAAEPTAVRGTRRAEAAGGDDASPAAGVDGELMEQFKALVRAFDEQIQDGSGPRP